MAKKTIDERLAKVFVKLDEIHDTLAKVLEDLGGDEREDAIDSAAANVRDAVTMLSYVTTKKSIDKAKKK